MANSPAAVASRPDWNQLPVTPSPAWYEVEKVRYLVAGFFSLIGGLSLATAKYSSLTLLNRTVPGFIWIGIAVISFGIAGSFLIPSLQDPAVALRLRQKVGRDLEASPDMTFVQFFQKYREAMDEGIVRHADLLPLFERDIQQLNYIEFMEKHTGGAFHLKTRLVDIVQKTAFEKKLRDSCRVAYTLDPAILKDTVDRDLLHTVLPYSPDFAVLAETRLGQFRWHHSANFSLPQAPEALKTLLIKERLHEIIYHPSSWETVEVLAKLPDDLKNSAQEALSLFELELFAEGGVTGGHVFKSWEEIVLYLPRVDPSKVEKIKAELRNLYLELNGVPTESMIRSLEITPEMIDEMQAFLAEECLKLDYLGPGGFREKYGSLHLQTLPSALKEKIKAELRLKLRDASFDLLESVLKDLKTLELLGEVLGPRWEKMSFENVVAKEFDLFEKYCGDVWSVEKVKTLIIEATQECSIFQIVHKFKQFFPRFLSPNDKFRLGKTFAEVAEQEMFKQKEDASVRVDYKESWSNYVSVIDLFPTLLQTGLLSYDSPALRQMLQKFLNRESKAILADKEESSREKQLFLRYLTLFKERSPQLENVYHEACLLVRQAQLECETELHQLTSSDIWKNTQQDFANIYREDHEANNRLSRIKEEHRKQFSDKVQDKEKELKRTREQLMAAQQRMRGLPLLQKKQEEQLQSLEVARDEAKRLLDETATQLELERKHIRSSSSSIESIENTRLRLNELERTFPQQWDDYRLKVYVYDKQKPQIQEVALEIEKAAQEVALLWSKLDSLQKELEGPKKQEMEAYQQVEAAEQTYASLKERHREISRIHHENEKRQRQLKDKYNEVVEQQIERLMVALLPSLVEQT